MKYISSAIALILCLTGCVGSNSIVIPEEMPTKLAEEGWIQLPALTEEPPMYINPSKITQATRNGRTPLMVISNLSKPQSFVGKTGKSVRSYFLIQCDAMKITMPFKTDVYEHYFGEGELVYTRSTSFKTWRSVNNSTEAKVLYHNVCNR